MSIALRFISEGKIQEFFVGWVLVKKVNGLNLMKYILAYLRDTLKLDLSFLRPSVTPVLYANTFTGTRAVGIVRNRASRVYDSK